MGILRRVEKFMSLIRRDLELSVRKDRLPGRLDPGEGRFRYCKTWTVFVLDAGTVPTSGGGGPDEERSSAGRL